MRDSELLLRRARRPLVIGMGGGGDVVGALATAELIRLYDGGDPVLGGLTWERRPYDPVPGPRAAAEITDAEELAPGILLAGPETRLRDRDVFFAESRMAEFLGQRTVLIDINDGAGPGRRRARSRRSRRSSATCSCSSTSAATWSRGATSRGCAAPCAMRSCSPPARGCRAAASRCCSGSSGSDATPS